MSRKTKLTLTVAQDVPSRAKAVADRLETSVSALVEDYLGRLADDGPAVGDGHVLDASDLDGFSGRILTARGGEVVASDQQRIRAAYLDNGWMVVDEEATASPEVAQVRAAVRAAGKIVHREIRVSEERIRRLYSPVGESRESGARRQFLDMIAHAVENQATDIYMSWDRKGTTSVRLRIHGVVILANEVPSDEADQMMAAVFTFTMSSSSDRNYKMGRYQDGMIEAESIMQDAGLSGVRFVITPESSVGHQCSLCLVPRQTVDQTLEQLGFDEGQVRDIRDMSARLGGLHVFSGPSGSGKSRTLAAILAWQQQRFEGGRMIVTVEDPVIYKVPGITQLAPEPGRMGTETERQESFHRALQKAIQSRPDVLMVSAIDDACTAALVVRAVLSGIQVWTTVASMTAFGIVPRLLELGVPPRFLSDPALMRLVSTQRILRTIDPSAAEPLSTDRDADDIAWLDCWASGADSEHHPQVSRIQSPDGRLATCKRVDPTLVGIGEYIGTVIVADVHTVRGGGEISDNLCGLAAGRSAGAVSGATMLDRAMAKALRREVALSEVIANVGL